MISISRSRTCARQPVGRQRKAQHAAGFGVRVEHDDLVPEQGEIEGGGQSGWTGADYGDLLAG